MNGLESKVTRLLPSIEKHGEIYLYALVEREDAKWDIVISSVWSDQNTQEVTRFIAKDLIPQLTKDELASLSRVVAIPSKEQTVLAFTSAMRVQGGRAEVVDCNFFGLQVKHAILFRSAKPPQVDSSERVEIAVAEPPPSQD